MMTFGARQFTRPNPWIGPDNQPYEVPAVLTNGHHGEIEAWKKQNALENTQKNRPDLMKNYLKKAKMSNISGSNTTHI